MGTGDEEGTGAPGGQVGEEETAMKKTVEGSNESSTTSPGAWIDTVSNL